MIFQKTKWKTAPRHVQFLEQGEQDVIVHCVFLDSSNNALGQQNAQIHTHIHTHTNTQAIFEAGHPANIAQSETEPSPQSDQ